VVPTPSTLPARSNVLVVVLSAVTLTALAVAGGWFLRRGDAPHVVAERGRVDAPGATQRQVAADGAKPPDPATVQNGDATREKLPEIESLSFAGAPECIPGTVDGVRVRVVAAEDRRPLPGARVYVVQVGSESPGFSASDFAWANQATSMSSLASPFYSDPARLTSVGAQGFLADANGEARVTWPFDAHVLIGFAEGRRGAQHLLVQGEAPVEFPLAKSEDLDVEVVGRDGKPIAGALVRVGRLEALGGTPQPMPEGGGAITDVSGRARIIDCGLVQDVEPRDHPSESAPIVAFVEFVGTSRESAWTELSGAVLKRGTVRITVGRPFGSVEIRVVDGAGHAEDVSSEATLSERGAVPVAGAPPDSKGEVASSRSSHGRPLVHGVARFAPVALGEMFWASHGVTTSRSPGIIAAGPTTDGAVTKLDVPIDPLRRSARGRILGIDLPLATDLELAVAARTDRQVHDPPPLPARLTKDGTFRMDWKPDDVGRVAAIRFSIELRDREAAYEATVTLPEDADGPVVDVGDIVAKPVPIRLSGRVIDDLGRAVARVRLRILPPSVRQDFCYEQLNGSLTSDASGRFVQFGKPYPDDRILEVTPPPGFERTRIPLQPDARDLEVVVARTGMILGTLACDLDARVVARPHGGGEPIRETPTFWQVRAKSLRLADPAPPALRPFHLELQPGRYDVLVTSGRQGPSDVVLARVDDVAVRAGEVTGGPRFAPLRFRSELFHWRIELTRSDGGPAPSSWICLAPSDAPGDVWRTDYSGTGTHEFDANLEEAWVDVFAPNFRRMHLLRTRGTVSIALEPIEKDEVAFELTLDPAAVVADLEFRVEADTDPPLPGSARDAYSARLAAGTTATVALDQGVPWRAHLFVVRTTKERKPRSASVELSRFARGVAPSTGSIRFDVTSADIADARAAIEKQLTR
jgi:hypothetical protein